MQTTYFEFREAANIEELRQLLKLRCKVYHESRMAGFSHKNTDGFDLNYYDLHARHFGLFKVDNGATIPIGYHRPVGEFESPVKREVMQIVAENPDLFESMSSVPGAPLPVMSYFPEASVLHELYRSCMSKGELMMEPTKYSIDKCSSSLQLAKHIIEAELAIHFFCIGVTHALMCVHVNHERFYSRYGFARVAGTNVCPVNGLPVVAIAVSRNAIPEALRPRLTKMAVAYLETRKVCYNPAEPNNFYAPTMQPEIREEAMRLAA
jgi:hypothetical protein